MMPRLSVASTKREAALDRGAGRMPGQGRGWTLARDSGRETGGHCWERHGSGGGRLSLGRVEALDEALQLGVEPLRQLVRQLLRLPDLLQDRLLGAQVIAQLLVEAGDVRDRNRVEVAVDARVDRRHLF